MQANILKCPACGAPMTRNNDDNTLTCPYCDTQVILNAAEKKEKEEVVHININLHLDDIADDYDEYTEPERIVNDPKKVKAYKGAKLTFNLSIVFCIVFFFYIWGKYGFSFGSFIGAILVDVFFWIPVTCMLYRNLKDCEAEVDLDTIDDVETYATPKFNDKAILQTQPAPKSRQAAMIVILLLTAFVIMLIGIDNKQKKEISPSQTPLTVEELSAEFENTYPEIYQGHSYDEENKCVWFHIKRDGALKDYLIAVDGPPGAYYKKVSEEEQIYIEFIKNLSTETDMKIGIRLDNDQYSNKGPLFYATEDEYYSYLKK